MRSPRCDGRLATVLCEGSSSRGVKRFRLLCKQGGDKAVGEREV
jgi:hypothetical protein